MKNRPEFQSALTRCVMATSARGRGFALALLAGLVFSGNALAAPCFAIDGTKATVHQLFASDPKAHMVDLEDMPSVSTMASRGSEAHNMIFMNIKRDTTKKNVTSFSAKIDDKTYEFPKDGCSKK